MGPEEITGPQAVPSQPASFDGELGRQIIALNIWAVDQGLRGAPTDQVFYQLCGRLCRAGVPLWRGFAGLQTLHPQWAGYVYTWRRDAAAVPPIRRERGAEYDRDLRDSPFSWLMREAGGHRQPGSWPSLRRRLSGSEAQLDFPILGRLAAGGATDYFAQIVGFGAAGDPSRGSGIGFSFATDRAGGFSDDDLLLIKAGLPAVALAIMSEAGHTIAGGLLAAYLGGDPGRRVHAGAVVRGSVESIRAVLLYADIRGFTVIADSCPGAAVIEMLNEVFDAITAPLRARGGEVLKFLGDGLLASFAFDETGRCDTCRQALDGAAAAMAGLKELCAARRAAGKPTCEVDFALHVGEVLYGNVGAVDRLDFTVIGPAVNEVARIETLCEPLGRCLLVSAEFADALGSNPGLCTLGHYTLRGVREPREIYGLVG